MKTPLNDQTPEWFRDAKFGIWVHWRPQCPPEPGDWYARNHNGAKYGMAFATHHDNFNSEYQPWNSVVFATGPAAAGHAGGASKFTF